MKFKPNLKMSRKDVEVDGKQVKCLNSFLVGNSGLFLKPGMFFIYRGDNAASRLARMHYRLKDAPHGQGEQPNAGSIVAQVAINPFMSNHCERWVRPCDVLATCPTERMDPEIVALFERRVSMWER